MGDIRDPLEAERLLTVAPEAYDTSLAAQPPG
jgi:hypothetical protein